MLRLILVKSLIEINPWTVAFGKNIWILNVIVYKYLTFVTVLSYTNIIYNWDGLPSYICAYCGKPAALSHLHASAASISVTNIKNIKILNRICDRTYQHTFFYKTCLLFASNKIIKSRLFPKGLNKKSASENSEWSNIPATILK